MRVTGSGTDDRSSDGCGSARRLPPPSASWFPRVGGHHDCVVLGNEKDREASPVFQQIGAFSAPHKDQYGQCSPAADGVVIGDLVLRSFVRAEVIANPALAVLAMAFSPTTHEALTAPASHARSAQAESAAAHRCLMSGSSGVL